MIVKLAKYWPHFLFLVQVLNGIYAGLTAFASALPDAQKATVLGWCVGIAGAVGGIQAFTRSLTDANSNGVPDIFEPPPPPAP